MNTLKIHNLSVLLQNEIGCDIGLIDNSFSNLTYSEQRVRKILHIFKWERVIYIPFKYEQEMVWIVCEDLVSRLPSLIIKQGRLL